MFFQKSDPAGYMNRKIDFARPYKKKSQNIIVVREITFAQSLYEKKIIFSNLFYLLIIFLFYMMNFVYK